MEFIPIFAGLLGTGYVIDKSLRNQTEAMDGDDAQVDMEEKDEEISETAEEYDNSSDLNIPTRPQYTVNRNVQVSDPNQPLELQGQHFRNREDTLYQNVPALPSGNRPFIPTARKHFWMSNHGTVDYREPGIGNVRLTTKPTDISVNDVLKRYHPNRKDFRDSNNNIVQTHSTGVDRIIPASEQEGYLLEKRRRKEWMQKYTGPFHRTDEINGKQMAVPKLVYGGSKQLPSMGNSNAWDTKRKNVAVTRIGNLSSQVQHDTLGSRATYSEFRLGKDTTVQGRTPMVKGISRSTRPLCADTNISQKEDKTRAPRQPGIHNSVYKEPNTAHFIKQSDSRAKNLIDHSFAIARLPASWQRRAGTMKGADTSAIDKSMVQPAHAVLAPFKQGIASIGINTRAGKNVAPMAYHEVFTKYMADRSNKCYKLGATIDAIGQSQGLHETTNLTFEQGLAARRC